MAIESDFLDLMPDTVTVYPSTGRDRYGKRTHSGTGVTYRAAVSMKQRIIKDSQGQEVVSIGSVYLYGAPALTTDHKIVLPDASVPVILSVETLADQGGDHHTKIMLGM